MALAGLLRSPAFGVSDAGLYRLFQKRNELGGTATLWNVVVGAGRDSPPHNDDGPRVARAAAVIAQLHAQAGRAPVADLLKDFLDATGYPAALIAAGQNRGARNIGKLLGDAHASGIVTAGEFLEYVAHLRDSGAREGEARATAEGAVQIMTVHAAKGLEFPVVALGDVTYVSSSRDALVVDPDFGVLLPVQNDDRARPGVYALARTRQDDQEAAESDRLLYVAATRAREKLIISGCAGLSAGGKLSRLTGWLGRIVEAHDLAESIETVTCDPDGANIIHLDWPIGRGAIACSIYEPKASNGAARPAVERVSPPAAVLPPPLLAPIAAAEEHVDPTTPGACPCPPRHPRRGYRFSGRRLDPPNRWGLIRVKRSAVSGGYDERRNSPHLSPFPALHRRAGGVPGMVGWGPPQGGYVFRRRLADRERDGAQRVWRVVPERLEVRDWRLETPAWVTGSLVHESLAAWRFPGDGYQAWAVARARGYGLAGEHQLAGAVRESSRLLERFQAHSLYSEMNAAERRLHEVPYSILVDGSPQSGIIDALYLRDGVWTIVEFRTDAIPDPSALEALLQQEDFFQQAARTVHAVEQLTGRRPRSLLCLLDCGGAVRVEEMRVTCYVLRAS